MQQQSDAVLEKLKALQERVDDLQEQVDELTCQITDLEQHTINIDNVSNAIIMAESALEFSDLDDIRKYTDEHVIILHTNSFRTAALASACAPSSGCRYNMHVTPADRLTPALLSSTINRAQKGDYILLKSHVFSLSDEFEHIISNAVTEGNVFFAICTSRLESIPQSLRENMRVIQ